MAKYSAEIKIAACKDYLEGKLALEDICQKYDIYYNKEAHWSKILVWVRFYVKHGDSAFISPPGNRCYSAQLKSNAVEDYFSGEGSLVDICVKYNIKSTSVLSKWISMYNANRELKDYNPKREVYMAEARRKTTIGERKEIVKYCIEHDRDYKGTASLYDVSYTQVYSWVRKYDADGEDALIDKRGHHKNDDEVDELERLRRENKRLKRQLEEKDMLVTLLKKVKELEGM